MPCWHKMVFMPASGPANQAAFWRKKWIQIDVVLI
jgi:hypothetical protein